MADESHPGNGGMLAHLKRRGVLRVAASYAVIAWLLLQIGDVVLDPFDFGDATMRMLLIVVAVGFPVALALAWFFELTPEGVEADHLPVGAPRPAVSGVRRYADVVIIGVLVIIVGVLLARQGGLIEAPEEAPVIAVLPFSNMSADDEYQYFGDGLADTMIQKLGQLNELVVLASQSTFQFKGDDLDLAVVAAKLGATTIMTGSVQRAGNSLRINARLVDAGSGRQLWAETYDRGVDDVFAIQDEIANAVTGALHLVLTPASEERLNTEATNNLSAYDAYVLGITRLAMRRGSHRRAAIGYFNQAIAEDPDYALAYTGLVEAMYLGAWAFDGTYDSLRAEMLAAADKAVELDPSLGEAWLARALVGSLDWQYNLPLQPSADEMIAMFEKAIALSPSNAMAHKYYSNFLNNSLRQRDEYSKDLMMKASRLDPRSGIIKLNVAERFIFEGNSEIAESWLLEATYSQEPYFAPAYMTLTDMYTLIEGRPDKSARWDRARLAAYPEDWFANATYSRALMDLGAWSQVPAVLDQVAVAGKKDSDNPINYHRWVELNQGMLMARAQGDLDDAYSLAQQMSREVWETRADWPVLERMGLNSLGMATLALKEIWDGDFEKALVRYEAAYPSEFTVMEQNSMDALHPVIMMAALQKITGEEEQAELLLRDYLEYMRGDVPRKSTDGPGWVEFTILAMLGETDQALATLEAIVDSGYVHQWWMLKDGAFDPDYAAVIADPRFEEQYARITARVDELREGFLANPELPEGYMR